MNTSTGMHRTHNNYKNTGRWKVLSCSLVNRSDPVKMAILVKAIYKLNAISIKVQTTFSIEIESIHPEVQMEKTRPQIAKEILNKSHTVCMITPDF